MLLATHGALADEQDTLNLIPAVSLMRDDNLFRLPSDARSEDIAISSLTLKLDKSFSLQRFELEASFIDYRYQTYSYLNYDATPYKAAWHWNLTPYLHGDLSADRATTLQSFADYSGYRQRNINTIENSRLTGVLDLSPSWHLLGGLSESSYTNTQITQGQGDNQIQRAEAGIRHNASSGSALSFITRSGRGDYLNRPQPIPAPLFLDNRFDENENEVRLLWALTGKMSLDARIAHLERNHTHFATRDYSGTVGNAKLSWNISGNSQLTAIAARELESYQTINANYTQTDRLALMPFWQFSSKTALRLRYDYARRDYLGTPGSFPASGRNDTLRTGVIALEWRPLRRTTLGASLQSENRSSNQPGFDYSDNIFNLTAQMTF
jgi:exopolysaccharide biosynthesis operon protein EpsL